jgi:hypothetical protein
MALTTAEVIEALTQMHSRASARLNSAREKLAKAKDHREHVKGLPAERFKSGTLPYTRRQLLEINDRRQKEVEDWVTKAEKETEVFARAIAALKGE